MIVVAPVDLPFKDILLVGGILASVLLVVAKGKGWSPMKLKASRRRVQIALGLWSAKARPLPDCRPSLVLIL